MKRPLPLPEPWRSVVMLGILLWLFASFATALYLQYSLWQAMMIAYLPPVVVYLAALVISRALFVQGREECKTIVRDAESNSLDARSPSGRDAQ